MEPRLGGKDDGRDAGCAEGHGCRGLPKRRRTGAAVAVIGSIAAAFAAIGPKGMADATGDNLRRF